MSLHNDAFTCSGLKTCCMMLRDLVPIHKDKPPRQILQEALPGITPERATTAMQSGCHFDYNELSIIAGNFNVWVIGTSLKSVTADGLRNGKAFERGTSTNSTGAPRPAHSPTPQVIQPRRLLLLLLQSLNNNISDVCDLLDLQRKFLLTGLELSQNQQTAISTLGITREQACQVMTAEEEAQLRNILNPQPQPKVKKPKEKRAEEMTDCNYLCLQYLARVVKGISLSTVCETLQLPKNAHYKWTESCPLRLAKFFKVLPKELNRILTDDEKAALEATLPKNAARPEPPPPAPPAAMAAPPPVEAKPPAPIKPAPTVEAKVAPPAVKARLVPPAAAKATAPANLSEEQQLLELMKSPGWTSIQHAFYVLRDFTPGNRTLALNWLNNKLRACK